MQKKILMILTVLAMCLAINGVAMAAEPAVVAVEGTGAYTVAPDQASVEFTVENTAKTVQLAQAENAQKAAQLSAALSRQGIYSKDIQSSYRLSPVYDRKEYSKIVGYTAENTFRVVVNDINKLGEVLDAAMANGATQVSDVSYGLKDEKAARNEALRRAVLDARSKADVIASTLGVKIIGVRMVKEQEFHMGRFELADAHLMKADGNAVPTPVAPGTIDFRGNVHIDYQIQ